MILLVEDETDLREILVFNLEQAGFEVTPASNGEEALKLIGTSPRQFRLLITDWTMPRMTGGQLAEKARALTPELKVIVISGLGKTEINAPYFFLEKPFTAQALLEQVNVALNV